MKISKRATYKTRNTGTDQTFPGILLNIPRNLLAHSPESCSTFPGIFWNIPRNFKIITFPGILKEIPRNSIEHWTFLYSWFYKQPENSPESSWTFPGIFSNIARNLLQHSPKSENNNIPRNPSEHSPRSPYSPHSVPRSCIPGFINNHQQSAILQFCKFFHLDLFRQMSAEKRISWGNKKEWVMDS